VKNESIFQRFKGKNVKIDLLTIKGAGHLVPMDRPEAALQMVVNFITNSDYSRKLLFNIDRQDLKPEYERQKNASFKIPVLIAES
jgi:hypothetical protein